MGWRQGPSDSSRANYAWAIEGHIKPALGTRRLRDLERDQIRVFFSKLELGDGGRGKVRTVLPAALNDAVAEHDLIAVNPAVGLKIAETQTLTEIAVWNAEQAKRFLRVAKCTEHFPLFLLAIVGARGPKNRE
jgi:hypothetical protein